MDTRCSPSRVFSSHAKDQRSNFFGQGFATSKSARSKHFQYSRKPERCHSITLLGVTRTNGFCQPDQNLLRTTQNNLCVIESRRRGRLLCNASNCCRRARFSRARFLRDPKLLTVARSQEHPVYAILCRCHTDETRGGICRRWILRTKSSRR